MLLQVQNRILTKDREYTRLTATVAVGGTTLTVRPIDSNAWADNDWLIVGEIGTSNAEVLQVNGTVSDGTSLTIDNAGSGGARYTHAVDEPVYRIDYNKIQFLRATTATGTKTQLALIEVQPDDYETRYEDATNTTGYGFARFYNSATAGYSPYSDEIPYTGQSDKSLAKLIKKVRTLLSEETSDYISDEQIVESLNDGQRELINNRSWTFNEVVYSMSRVANQFAYTIDSRIRNVLSVSCETRPLVNIGYTRWQALLWKTNSSSDDQSHVAIWNREMLFYPRPSTSATATTLNGGITATDTTITVVSTSSFSVGDYYRFIIDDEVIYATGATTTTFTGCSRGKEGTTAAAHTTSTAVTERDIVISGQAFAVDLAQLNDETIIPEPIILAYYAAADLAHGKIKNSPLGDRYDIKYKNAAKELETKFSIKLTGQFSRIKNRNEVTSDAMGFINPNDYPTNVTEAL